MRFRAFVLLALLGLSSATLGAQNLEVTKRAILRGAPARTSPKVASLLKGELLDAADLTTTNGYYHVTTSEGDDGWVIQSAVRLVAPSPGEMSGREQL